MADRAVVFAMANPTPEILPEEIEGLVEVIATGRSDYPNQLRSPASFVERWTHAHQRSRRR